MYIHTHIRTHLDCRIPEASLSALARALTAIAELVMARIEY